MRMTENHPVSLACNKTQNECNPPSENSRTMVGRRLLVHSCDPEGACDACPLRMWQNVSVRVRVAVRLPRMGVLHSFTVLSLQSASRVVLLSAWRNYFPYPFFCNTVSGGSGKRARIPAMALPQALCYTTPAGPGSARSPICAAATKKA